MLQKKSTGLKHQGLRVVFPQVGQHLWREQVQKEGQLAALEMDSRIAPRLLLDTAQFWVAPVSSPIRLHCD